MSEELWRPVRHLIGTEFEGYYEVSNLGRVRSLDRVVTFAHRRCGVLTRTVRGVVIKPQFKTVLTNGHPHTTQQVTFWLGSGEGEYSKHILARLVWEAFNGLIPEGMCIGHTDRDWSNCALSSLRLMTLSEALRAPYRKITWRKKIPGYTKAMRAAKHG